MLVRMKPPVSVCIPTYNGAKYLHNCIQSVLEQTFKDFEVLLVDDASSDDTVVIAQDYVRRDSRIRLYHNTRNLGLVGNWNRCVELSEGEWLKFVFQDDFLELNCLEQLLDARRPGVGLVVGRRNVLFEPEIPQELKCVIERYISEHNLARHFPDRSFISPEQFAEHMVCHPVQNCIGEPTATLLHRSVFKQFGQFHPYLVQLCDWEHSARIAVHTGLCYVDDALATFRVHGGSATVGNRSSRSYRSDVLDPLIIFHDLVYASGYAPVRAAARRCNPRVNLMHQLVRASRKARWLAYSYANEPVQPNTQILADWENVVERYPRLTYLPLSYIVAAGVRRTTSLCRAVVNRVRKPASDPTEY